MRIQYKLEDKDISALIKHLYDFSEGIRKATIRLYFIIMPLLMLTITSLFASEKSVHLIVQIGYVIYHTFFWSAILTPFVFPLLYNWVIKKRFNKIPRVFDVRAYSILDNGISFKQHDKEILYEWKEIVKVVESETHYFIHLNNTQVVIIPIRVLDSETNYNLKQILQQKKQPYKQIKSKSGFRKFLTVFRGTLIFIYIILPFINWNDNSSQQFEQDYFNFESAQSFEESKGTASINLNNVSLSVQNLLDKYPSQKTAFSGLPVKYQEKMVVLTLSEIPFNIKEVEVYNNVINGETDSAYIFFSGQEERLAIRVYEKESINTRGRETIQLNKNITGYYNDRNEEMSISWSDPEIGSDFAYSVGLFTHELDSLKKKENKFKRKDIINITNSVIENYTLNDK